MLTTQTWLPKNWVEGTKTLLIDIELCPYGFRMIVQVPSHCLSLNFYFYLFIFFIVV